MAITAQEAWVSRDHPIDVPPFIRQIVEEVAFQARSERKIDKRSGVSRRMPISVLESLVSNAERRALLRQSPVVRLVVDMLRHCNRPGRQVRARCEGELETLTSSRASWSTPPCQASLMASSRMWMCGRWSSGSISAARSISRTPSSAAEVVSQARGVQGLIELAHRAAIAPDAPKPLIASGVDFVLEGLLARRRKSDGPTSAGITAPSRYGGANRQPPHARAHPGR